MESIKLTRVAQRKFLTLKSVDLRLSTEMFLGCHSISNSPSVGKIDEILANYYFQCKGERVFFVIPTVVQLQNENDLAADFAEEAWDYEDYFKIARNLDSGTSLFDLENLPPGTKRAFGVWLDLAKGI
jgi:hypothetical protein